MPALADGSEPLQQYLTHLRVGRRVAERTMVIYTAALSRLRQASQDQGLPLAHWLPHHVRRLAASLHGQGLSPRSLALHLSAWRGFYRWWGREGGVALNPVEGVRAPKAAKPLAEGFGGGPGCGAGQP